MFSFLFALKKKKTLEVDSAVLDGVVLESSPTEKITRTTNTKSLANADEIWI